MSFEPTRPNVLSSESVLTALVPLWDAGEETRVLPHNGECTFGSDRSNNVRLVLNGIAPQHCRVTCADGGVTVQPINGSPVRLNDTPVADMVALSAGDKLAIGPASFRVEHRSRRATPRQTLAASAPRTPSPATVNPPGGRRASDPAAPPVPVVPASARPAAKPNLVERQQQLLKEREVQLQNWQRQLDQRSQELDGRSSRIAEQQAKLQQQELAFEQRCAEIESKQQQALETATREHEQRAAKLQQDQSAHSDEVAGRTAKLEAWHTELQQLEFQLRESAEQDVQSREAVQAECAAAMQEIEELRTQLRQQENDLEIARAELEASTQNHETHVETVRAEFAERESAIAADRAEFEQREHELMQSSRELDSRIEQLDAAKDAFQAEHQDRLVETTAVEQRRQAREEELAAWEAELNARYEEAASRVRDVKRLSAEATTAAGAEAEQQKLSAAENQKQAEQLEETQRELDRVTIERDDVTTALNELRAAFESMRDELLNAEQNAASNTTTDNTTSDNAAADDAAAAIAERDEALAAANEALMAQIDAVRTLEERVTQLTTDFETERQQLAEQLQHAEQSTNQNETSETDEGELLQQIEQLKTELSSSAEAGGPSDELHVQQIQQYESSIQDLSEQLEEARTLIEQQSDADEGIEQQYIDLITELKQRLQEQDAQLAALASSDATDAPSPTAEETEELQRQQRELDDRTHVLDDREAELRERRRMLDHSEEEVETHRRELLDARQQLELARAELQVAAESPSPEPPAIESPMLDAPAVELPAPESAESEPETDEQPTELAVPVASEPIALEHVEEPAEELSEGAAAPQVRSELAELFGIGSTTVDEPGQDDDVPELPAVDDYSQETAAAVSMSFSEADSVLLEAPLDHEAVNEDAADDGDDFVAEYMEQLLSRSRTGAGAALPEELSKKANKAPTPAPKKEEKPAAAPGKTKSFIDAYMSGEYKEATVEPEPVAAESSEPAPKKPAEPRAKVDLHALRNEMASFRQLSTKSVENALASHAKQKEKGGITTRWTIFIALSVVCVFVVAAALTGIIPFGLFAWLAIVSVLASGGELAYKLWQLKEKLKESSDLLNHGAASDADVAADAESGQVRAAENASVPGPVSASDSNYVEAAGQQAADATPATDLSVAEPTESGVNATETSEDNLTPLQQAMPADSAAELPVVTNATTSEPITEAPVAAAEPATTDLHPVEETVVQPPATVANNNDEAIRKPAPKSWLDMLPTRESNSVENDHSSGAEEVPVADVSAEDESVPMDDITEIVDELPLTTPVSADDVVATAETLKADDVHLPTESELVEFDGEEYFEI